jgi:hypothetical protein
MRYEGAAPRCGFAAAPPQCHRRGGRRRAAFVTVAKKPRAGLWISADVKALHKFSRRLGAGLPTAAAIRGRAGIFGGPVSLACCRLVLTDEGEVALAGATPPAADWSIALRLYGQLRSGNYTVEAAVVVGGDAVDLAIARIHYVID